MPLVPVKALQVRNLWFAHSWSEEGEELLVQLRPFLIGDEKAKPVWVDGNSHSWIKDFDGERAVVMIARKLYPCTTIEGARFYEDFSDLLTVASVLREYQSPDERYAA